MVVAEERGLADVARRDVVVCRLSGPDDVASLEPLRCLGSAAPAIVVTGHGGPGEVLEAFRRGAWDYLPEPVAEDEVASRVRAIRDRLAAWRGMGPSVATATQDPSALGMVGESPSMRQLFRLVATVAETRANVLVTGESGTGKELVARAIHRASPLRRGPFLALNCAAIPGPLLESELFGHVRGSFTDAHADRAGYFEAAADGTLFLDEVSEIPIPLQAKLLRAIETRSVTPVGGRSPVPVRARFVAATNRDLREECRAGRFRDDLYYRLRVAEVHVPALKERGRDALLLAEHAIALHRDEVGKDVRELDREAERLVLRYAWPGNVRELDHAVLRAMLVTRSERLGVDDFPVEVREGGPLLDLGDGLRGAMRRKEAEHIAAVLAAAGGNRQEAARRLGVDPSTLYRKMKALGLRTDDGDEGRLPVCAPVAVGLRA